MFKLSQPEAYLKILLDRLEGEMRDFFRRSYTRGSFDDETMEHLYNRIALTKKEIEALLKEVKGESL